MFGGRPYTLRVLFGHPDVLCVIFSVSIVRMVLNEKIESVPIRGYHGCGFMAEGVHRLVHFHQFISGGYFLGKKDSTKGRKNECKQQSHNARGLGKKSGLQESISPEWTNGNFRLSDISAEKEKTPAADGYREHNDHKSDQVKDKHPFVFCLTVGHFFGSGSCKCNKYDGDDHRRVVLDQPIAGLGILHSLAGELNNRAHKKQDQADEKL